ncbi:hypothetical protein FB451DRAFT_1247702, partial [Mycena latifolia]
SRRTPFHQGLVLDSLRCAVSQVISGALIIPIVILCYDHLLTLESEITFVWRRPKRLSFFLFFLLRYFSLLSNIGMIILNFGNLPMEQCHAWNIGKIVLIIIQCILVGNILGLRVYAMYNFSKTVLFILIITGLIASTLAVWSVTGQTWILAIEVTGCDYAVSKQRRFPGRFFCDVAIFGFTIMRSFRQPFKIPGSILSRMARDAKSTTPYSVLALVNLGNILMYYPWIAASLSWFTSTISVTMVSRLMLNLHEAADVGILTDQSTFTALSFGPQHNIQRDAELNIDGEY